MKDAAAWVKRKETSAGNYNRVMAFIKSSKKKPLFAFDCSGLITTYLLAEKLIKEDVSSRGLYKMCRAVTFKAIKPGDFVFKRNLLGVINHVGVYVGGNSVIEAKGRDYGVVKSEINGFTDVGRYFK